MSKKKRSFHKKSSSRDFLTGRLFVTRKGIGFIEVNDQEYFISAKNANGAMDGDTVAFRSLGKNHLGKMGRVMRVIERKHATIVGRFEQYGALGVVVPRDRRIAYDAFVDAQRSLSAQPGDWVRATISAYPTRYESLQVVITEIIEEALNKASEEIPQSVILASNDIIEGFSADALQQAREARMPTEQEWHKDPFRRDIRDRAIFTIDPADARDFDDAISIESVPNGTRLGVHIADVSAYVEPGSPLDKDARLKSTSTYLPTEVIPMLPEELSNGLCSLNPGEDRLALSVDILFGHDYEMLSADFYPSVIRSKERYSYDEVLAMLQGAAPYRTDEQRAILERFSILSEHLAKRRLKRGGLDFNTLETKVKCREDGTPYDIVVRSKTRATEMIEEAMILANEVVAAHLYRAHMPSILRVHEPPTNDSLDAIADILKEFGYRLPAQADVSSATFQKILEAAQGTPEEYLVSTVLLRTLKQAYYSPEPLGHFGLASEFYTHFTSPIRRYPDLEVHRFLKALIYNDRENPEVIEAQENLEGICQHCSVGERNAQNAEREATRYKLCAYLKGKVGETFSGIISNAAHFGLFVTLDNSAEGLVHKAHLPSNEIWSYDARHHQLVNEKRTKRYRLGQPIRVVLLSVNLEEGLLDFTLAE